MKLKTPVFCVVVFWIANGMSEVRRTNVISKDAKTGRFKDYKFNSRKGYKYTVHTLFTI